MATALVTGASSGIGRALARGLALRGHDLILTARSAPALRSLARELQGERGVRVETVALDLARPGSADEVLRVAAEWGLEIEILVNDAGVGSFGDFADAKWEDLAQILALNVSALTELTHRVLPAMRARGRGRILMVASTAAFAPGPRTAVYAASKAYVLAFAQALAVELERDGISVTTLCPGRTDTEFARRSGWREEHQLRGKRALSPDEVARSALDALESGKRMHVPGAANRVFSLLARALPPPLAARGVSWLRRGGEE